MKIKALITELVKLDQDLEVRFINWDGASEDVGDGYTHKGVLYLDSGSGLYNFEEEEDHCEC